ncbi:Subunit of heteropentameric Replication factor C (RF-C), partial [Perkinsus chesapeaki]
LNALDTTTSEPAAEDSVDRAVIDAELERLLTANPAHMSYDEYLKWYVSLKNVQRFYRTPVVDPLMFVDAFTQSDIDKASSIGAQSDEKTKVTVASWSSSSSTPAAAVGGWSSSSSSPSVAAASGPAARVASSSSTGWSSAQAVTSTTSSSWSSQQRPPPPPPPANGWSSVSSGDSRPPARSSAGVWSSSMHQQGWSSNNRR